VNREMIAGAYSASTGVRQQLAPTVLVPVFGSSWRLQC